VWIHANQFDHLVEFGFIATREENVGVTTDADEQGGRCVHVAVMVLAGGISERIAQRRGRTVEILIGWKSDSRDLVFTGMKIGNDGEIGRQAVGPGGLIFAIGNRVELEDVGAVSSNQRVDTNDVGEVADVRNEDVIAQVALKQIIPYIPDQDVVPLAAVHRIVAGSGLNGIIAKIAVDGIIARFAAEENKPVAGLTPQAAQLIQNFTWPGNVRQLENTIFRAVVLCDGAMLDVCDFPQIAAAMGVEAMARQTLVAPMPALNASTPALSMHSPYALPVTDASGHIRKFEALESEIIRMAIGRYEGHMSEVARRLGIGRSTLYRKLKEFGLEGDVTPEATEAARKAG